MAASKRDDEDVIGPAGFRWPLACGLVLATCSVFYVLSIAPRGAGRSNLRDVSDMRGRVAEARKTIGRFGAEQDATVRARVSISSRTLFLRDRCGLVAGADPGYFACFGMAVPVIRLNRTMEDPECPATAAVTFGGPAHRRGPANVTGLLLAVAEFEEQHPSSKCSTSPSSRPRGPEPADRSAECDSPDPAVDRLFDRERAVAFQGRRDKRRPVPAGEPFGARAGEAPALQYPARAGNFFWQML